MKLIELDFTNFASKELKTTYSYIETPKYAGFKLILNTSWGTTL